MLSKFPPSTGCINSRCYGNGQMMFQLECERTCGASVVDYTTFLYF